VRAVIIPSVEEMVEINKQLGGEVINRGNLEFVVSKMEARHRNEDFKKQIAKASATIWAHIIQLHPFSNGNKRTATEAMLLLLEKNNFALETSTAGKVYVSLKLANNEMTHEELVGWIHARLMEVSG
jgi:death-on-curing family protein